MNFIQTVVVGSLSLVSFAANAASSEVEAAKEDIVKTLGLVPSFFKAYPEEALPGAWEEFKAIQLSSDGKLSNKLRELIGLGVASQVPCSYCTYAHTEFAKFGGATDAEVKETVAVAACVRGWSTFMSGMQLDLVEFKKETDAVVRYLKSSGESSEMPRPMDTAQITTREIALQDIRNALGLVPRFIELYPSHAVVGTWKNMRKLYMEKTALSSRDKALIGVAVSAQIPCQHCLYWDGAMAKLEGASEEEIAEAIAMASMTRKWSTVLNGMQIDESVFKGEVDQIVEKLQRDRQGAPRN